MVADPNDGVGIEMGWGGWGLNECVVGIAMRCGIPFAGVGMLEETSVGGAELKAEGCDGGARI